MTTKESVLALLESSRGESVSGESLAAGLSISRGAVWKAVRELRKEGYIIAAATNRGYCLNEGSDIISAQGILPYLDNKDLAKNIRCFETLESTNITAKEMAMSGADHGTVVITGSQTAGRGRNKRSFFSPSSSGIYMSVVLHPDRLCFSTPTLVTAFAAVCVCEAVENVFGLHPAIKWVNDVMLDGKKICGILTEAVSDIESGGVQWMVVGIGINVTVPPGGFPAEINETAGALFLQSSPPAARNRLTAEVINRMLSPEITGSDEDMLARYRKRMLMMGEKITVTGAGGTYEATMLGVDGTGRLIVKNKSGETLNLSSAEISIRRV